MKQNFHISSGCIVVISVAMCPFHQGWQTDHQTYGLIDVALYIYIRIIFVTLDRHIMSTHNSIYIYMDTYLLLFIYIYEIYIYMYLHIIIIYIYIHASHNDYI